MSRNHDPMRFAGALLAGHSVRPINHKPPFGNGVNVQPSYAAKAYGDLNFGWDLMRKSPKIKTVRIEIEPDMARRARQWIHLDLCNAPVAAERKVTPRRFTINLTNEWGDHTTTAQHYAEAYNAALPIVRTVYQGPIIIDAPGWGQGALRAAAAIRGDTASRVRITDRNVIVSVHIYPSASVPGDVDGGKLRSMTVDDLKQLGAAGVDCMVGEFGSMPAAGGANWQELVRYAKSLGWPVLAWAWNGHGPQKDHDGQKGMDPNGIMNMVHPTWYEGCPPSASLFPSSYFKTVYALL